MNEHRPAVARAWHSHRRRVLDVCYRMLGTLIDAEDAVQETYARLPLASCGLSGGKVVPGQPMPVAASAG